MDQETALFTIKAIQEECYKCKACELGQPELLDGYDPHVLSSGNLAAELMFCAEAPGKDETIQRVPLIGKSGQVFEKYVLGCLGLDRKDVYITNTVLCRPPGNRKPTPAERKTCQPFLRKQLALVKPKLVVVLGAVPMSVFLGIESGITKLAGQKFYSDEFNIDVFILPHPSYILRTGQYELFTNLVNSLSFIVKSL